MESTTFKPMELQLAQRQQFRFLCQHFRGIYWNNTSKQIRVQTNSLEMLHGRYFSLRDISKSDFEASIEQANLHHPTIKFTAETSDTETVFLDTVVYKGSRFKEKSILDAKTNFKQTETFLYTQKKDLSKKKPWESYEKTPQKQTLLRKIIRISKEAW